jgi:hypothetical protein
LGARDQGQETHQSRCGNRVNHGLWPAYQAAVRNTQL